MRADRRERGFAFSLALVQRAQRLAPALTPEEVAENELEQLIVNLLGGGQSRGRVRAFCQALAAIDFTAPPAAPEDGAGVRNEVFWSIEYSRALIALLVLGGGREDLRWALRGLERAGAALQDIDAGVCTPHWLLPLLNHRPPASSYERLRRLEVTVACDAMVAAVGISLGAAAKEFSRVVGASPRTILRWHSARGGAPSDNERIARARHPQAFGAMPAGKRKRAIFGGLEQRLSELAQLYGQRLPVSPPA